MHLPPSDITHHFSFHSNTLPIMNHHSPDPHHRAAGPPWFQPFFISSSFWSPFVSILHSPSSPSLALWRGSRPRLHTPSCTISRLFVVFCGCCVNKVDQNLSFLFSIPEHKCSSLCLKRKLLTKSLQPRVALGPSITPWISLELWWSVRCALDQNVCWIWGKEKNPKSKKMIKNGRCSLSNDHKKIKSHLGVWDMYRHRPLEVWGRSGSLCRARGGRPILSLIGKFSASFSAIFRKKKSRKTPPFLLIRPLVRTQPTPTHPSPGRSLRAPHPSVCQIEGGGEFDFLLREGEGIFLLWGGFKTQRLVFSCDGQLLFRK